MDEAETHDNDAYYFVCIEVIKKAWELGLVNTHIESKYGGNELGVLDSALITEELAFGCTGKAKKREKRRLCSLLLLRYPDGD
jgi:alkylation response protein AidB-like acyl-CoA dehydrogenase